MSLIGAKSGDVTVIYKNWSVHCKAYAVKRDERKFYNNLMLLSKVTNVGAYNTKAIKILKWTQLLSYNVDTAVECWISTINLFNSIFLFEWPIHSQIPQLSVQLNISKTLIPAINLTTDLESS